MTTFTGDASDNQFTGGIADDLATGAGGDDALDGLGGDDFLVGGDGQDALDGGEADDWLDGGAGDDWLTGGEGSDVLLSGAGADLLSGGGGGDLLYFGADFDASDQADGGDGGDAFVLQGRYAGALALGAANLAAVEAIVLLGEDNTAFDHVADGPLAYSLVLDDGLAAAGDWLVVAGALAADETLQVDGSAETDGRLLLVGGAGADSLTGGAGDDALIGGAGSDLMRGGAGDDAYAVDDVADIVDEQGGGGSDTVYTSLTLYALGADVEDLVFVTAGANVGFGNAAANRLVGNDAADLLDGGAGDDRLDGGAGVDFLLGGLGDDVYYVATGDAVVEAAGAGLDTVYARESFALAAGSAVELIATADWRLTHRLDLTGNELNNAVTGNSGVNVLRGGGGGDTLRGLGGHDTLDGGAGIDQLFGGAGDDSYYVTAGDRAIELAGEGFDSVYAHDSFALAAGSAVELLATADWRLTTRLDLAGNELNNAITGNSGVNVLTGGAGDDTLRGLAGNDTLDGGDDGDILIGGAGDDNYYVTGGDQVVELAGEGFDSVYARSSFGLGAGSAVELLGTVDWRATTAIDLTGNELANSVTGNNGVNSLGGLAGNDTLRGMGGNDTLDGGAGRDTLYGGEGDDIFAFTTALGGDQVDHLADFDAAHDTIALDDARFAGLGLGALAASAFQDGTAALDASDRVIYDQATGKLFFDADGSGAGAQVLFATLSAGTALTAADVLVI